MNRGSVIFGEGADKAVGFLVGLFGNVIGLIGTVVVIYIWAGNDGSPETTIRRRHAASVSMWAGVGCAIPWIIISVVTTVIVISVFRR